MKGIIKFKIIMENFG